MLPGEVRGIGFGVLATINGVGDLISSALVGSLWVLSPAAAMLFVIATSLIGAAIIARTRPVAPLAGDQKLVTPDDEGLAVQP
jgi:hypothetical protein